MKHTKRGLIIGLFLALQLTMLASYADSERTFRLSSGERQIALVELYTSEGCSSCPPADRWFSALRDDARLWQHYVPIALHVDYWNYIGWDDRFASPAYSRRQRDYTKSGAAKVSYTPGMFRAGNEWLDWRRGTQPYSDDVSVGNLSVAIDGRAVAVRFDPIKTYDRRLEVHVAVLGMGLESVVKAGENKGRTLRHDFVSLLVQNKALTTSDGGYTATLNIDSFEAETDELALVAWVSRSGEPAPLQSVGGYLPQALGAEL